MFLLVLAACVLLLALQARTVLSLFHNNLDCDGGTSRRPNGLLACDSAFADLDPPSAEELRASLGAFVPSVARYFGEICLRLEMSDAKSTHDAIAALRGLTLVRFLGRSACPHGCLVEVSGVRIAVFRGSLLFREWIRTLLYSQVPTQRGLVHRGFKNLADGYAEDIEGFSPLLLCGHSSGAAVAILLAVALSDLGRRCAVVTFGCPRVGDVAFARSLNGATPFTVRVHNSEDLFSSLPMPLMPSLSPRPVVYAHGGHEIAVSTHWGSFLNNHLLGAHFAADWKSSRLPLLPPHGV